MLISTSQVAIVAAYRMRRLSGRKYKNDSPVEDQAKPGPTPYDIFDAILRHFVVIDNLLENDLSSYAFAGIQPYIKDTIKSIQTLLDNLDAQWKAPLAFPLSEYWGDFNGQE